MVFAGRAVAFHEYPLQPPRDLRPADGVEAVVTVVIVAVFLAVLAWVVSCARRDRDPIGPLVMLGAVIAVVNDPLVEVAGRCFFYTEIPAFNTMGREMPLWGPFAYGILFGTETFILYRLARRGALDLRRLRLIVLSTFALDLAIEVPVLQTDLYVYYGIQPFEVAGFPLYWVFLNTPAVIIGSAVLVRQRHWFNGRRAPLALLVPVFAIPASFYTAGLPVLAAMNSTLPEALVWVAAVVSAAFSVLIMEATGRVLCGGPGVREQRGADVRAATAGVS